MTNPALLVRPIALEVCRGTSGSVSPSHTLSQENHQTLETTFREPLSRAEFGELRQFLKLDEKEEDVTDILDVPDLTPDQADQLLKELDSADKSTAS